MTSHLQGTCERFCPAAEEKLRIQEKLLHFYELKNGQKNVPGILVKSFARSAAGIKSPKPADMRTERCLRETINYLLTEILTDQRKPFHVAYDFIFDRLRAVRQEIVIQNYSLEKRIALVEPIIFFLAYSSYRLCTASTDNFDPKINEKHLQECLLMVLSSYNGTVPENQDMKSLKKRNYIESIYQILNLGSTEALSRCLFLPMCIRCKKPFSIVYSIVLNCHYGNLYRFFMNVEKLPHILGAVAALKLQYMRRKLLEIFATAYNSKQLTVPVEFIRRIMLYSNDKDIISDINYYNLKLTKDFKYIEFIKTNFKNDAGEIKPRHESVIESNFRGIDLSNLLLLKEI